MEKFVRVVLYIWGVGLVVRIVRFDLFIDILVL